jgi:hypothetical protein
MLKSERRLWVREVREGKPFKDMERVIYLDMIVRPESMR